MYVILIHLSISLYRIQAEAPNCKLVYNPINCIDISTINYMVNQVSFSQLSYLRGLTLCRFIHLFSYTHIARPVATGRLGDLSTWTGTFPRPAAWGIIIHR